MLKKLLGVTTLFLWTSAAYSLIEMEAYYGHRWYESKDALNQEFKSSGPAYSVGVNLDPIPMLPLAFGASYTIVDLEKSDFTGSPNSAKVSELGLDLKAWVPMVPVFTPYLRARYVLESKLEVTYTNTPTLNTDTNLHGYHIGVGIEYRIIPLLHVFAEVDQAFETADSFGNKKEDFNSRGFMAGISVGI